MNFLIIQTAFIGDVILATAVVEKIHHFYPAAKIDFLLRKGNGDLLLAHPLINEVIIWDKKKNKLNNLFRLTQKIRRKKYEYVINLHRYASSGLVTALSGARHKFGFDKNPFSFTYTHQSKHQIGTGKHEVTRNLELIADITDAKIINPKLYPSEKDFATVRKYKEQGTVISDYVCIAPASVWYTKQFPQEKWVALIHQIPASTFIYLLGAPADFETCEAIKSVCQHPRIENLAGKLGLLESAALMKDAKMNYVNDSAPMHIASAMDAPVTAIFCSTVPAFGFGPLSSNSKIVETKEKMDCRPCGLHGFRTCPEGHFKCAITIKIEQVLN